MKIFLVRHGQTEWNVLHKVQGKVDIDLNDVGVEQAEDVRDILLSTPIDFIICSPLKRASHTASIINGKRNIPVIYDRRISERDFGEFEGKRQEDFDFSGFWSYKKNERYESAENIRDFFDRVYRFLDDIIAQYPDKNILLVNHGGVSIPIDCYFNGIPADDNLLKLVAKNAEVKVYDVAIECNSLQKSK